MKQPRVTVFLAAAIRDAQGTSARPGAIAVRNGKIVAAGRPDDLPKRIVERAETVDYPESLLMPTLVNAHTHLDLTGIGQLSYHGDFIGWLRSVMDRRPREPGPIAEAVHQGMRLAREAGVGYMGDVAGSVAAIESRIHAPRELIIPGVSYLECVGIGRQQAEQFDRTVNALDQLPFETPVPGQDRGVVLGIEPHAPYSTGKQVYELATKLSHRRIYRLATHLAESQAELEFVRSGTGPFAELLKSLGKWDQTIQPAGSHPVDWLEPELKRGRWLLAHCNYVDNRHIEILQRTGTAVAYCPVASDYFGHRGHRYLEMLEEGVNVCVGTDSILCQGPADHVDDQPLSVFRQMRYLYRRDGTAPETLLKMGTTNGMLALEYSEADATLRKGAPANFAAVAIDPTDDTDPLTQALTSGYPVRNIDVSRTLETSS
jgi:cytosine/adenosine deaminase-related metal-dependent hydrolase